MGMAPVTWPGMEWVNVAIEHTFRAAIGYFPYESTPVALFTHYIDGVKQDGVFLGAAGYNSTTWVFSYRTASSGTHGREYFNARLVGLNKNVTVDSGSFTGFIKAVGL